MAICRNHTTDLNVGFCTIQIHRLTNTTGPYRWYIGQWMWPMDKYLHYLLYVKLAINISPRPWINAIKLMLIKDYLFYHLSHYWLSYHLKYPRYFKSLQQSALATYMGLSLICSKWILCIVCAKKYAHDFHACRRLIDVYFIQILQG